PPCPPTPPTLDPRKKRPPTPSPSALHPTHRPVSFTSREAPTAAQPAITVERLALLPLPYGTFAVSPCTTRTSSMETCNSSATIWLKAVAMPWPTELQPE